MQCRRGAPQAQLLYRETEESISAREKAAELRKAGALGIQTDGRPTKKQRRQIHRFSRDIKFQMNIESRFEGLLQLSREKVVF